MLLQQALADIFSQAGDVKKDRKYKYNVILRRVRGTIFAVEKRKYYTLRRWVFLILISSKQCAYAILSFGVPDSAIFFPHYLINGTIFEKINYIGNKMSVLIFYRVLSTTFHTLRITERDAIKNVNSTRVKTPVFLVSF
jgi:hypothetical protein